MNRFSQFLLSTTALSFVSLGTALAAPVLETTDFGENFATRALALGTGPVSGSVGFDVDSFDVFQLSGFVANSTVNISATFSAGGSGAGMYLHLLDSAGNLLFFPGDSGGGTVGAPVPESDFGTFTTNGASAFNFNATALSDGTLNVRVGSAGFLNYTVTATGEEATSIAEPSSILPMAAGLSGLGFLATRRRRKKAD